MMTMRCQMSILFLSPVPFLSSFAQQNSLRERLVMFRVSSRCETPPPSSQSERKKKAAETQEKSTHPDLDDCRTRVASFGLSWGGMKRGKNKTRAFSPRRGYPTRVESNKAERSLTPVP
ncbi:hypothetical protein GGR56DRAFT_614012 [Xylariaceae sp. FL0804]|nr:hypothetical protein GGR56DRAFT_614012 [Xylariaceae sp. FL0804]